MKDPNWCSSGRTNPCLLCERTKDADCSWTLDEGTIFCHTYIEGDSPNYNYKYKETRDNGYGLQVGVHIEKKENYTDKSINKKVRVKNKTMNKQQKRGEGEEINATSTTTKPKDITLLTCTLATTPKVAYDTTLHPIPYKNGKKVTEPIKAVYGFQSSEKQTKYRYEFEIAGQAKDDKVFSISPTTAKNPSPWLAYPLRKLKESVTTTPGAFLLMAEGEKKCDSLIKYRLACVSPMIWGKAKIEQESGLVEYCQNNQLSVVYLVDNDPAGLKKAQEITSIWQKKGLELIEITMADLGWVDAPPKADIEDYIQDYLIPLLSKQEVTPPPMPEEQQIQEELVRRVTEAIRIKRAAQEKAVQKELEKEESKKDDQILCLSKSVHILEFLNKTHKSIKLNIRTQKVEIDGVEIDIETRKSYYAKNYRVEISEANLINAILFNAKENQYDPVKLYLEECHKNYPIISLDKISLQLFGIDSELYDQFFIKFLIGAVQRVYEPGCKFDEILVLHSRKQGMNKSTFFKVLSNGFFTDSMTENINKDEILKAYACWIIEWGEVDRFTRKTCNGTIKNFLSGQADMIRKPYGRTTEKMKRNFVMTGSTNQDSFLNDPTGDRRWWVIPIKKKIDIEWVEKNRHSLWATAVHLYLSGETCKLDEKYHLAQNNINEQFREEDLYESILYPLLECNNEVTFKKCADFLIQKNDLKVLPNTSEMYRVQRVLQKFGFQKTAKRDKGESNAYIWVKKNDDIELEREHLERVIVTPPPQQPYTQPPTTPPTVNANPEPEPKPEPQDKSVKEPLKESDFELGQKYVEDWTSHIIILESITTQEDGVLIGKGYSHVPPYFKKSVPLEKLKRYE